MIDPQNVGPWRITKNIPGLQTLLESLGVVSDRGTKAPATQWLPFVSLVLQINPDGTLTTVINNAGPTPASSNGFLLGVNIGNPAAGSDFTVPLTTLSTQAGVTMARARIMGMSALFATSAAAANRGVNLIWKGAGDTLSPSPSIISQFNAATAEVASNGGRLFAWTPGAIAEAVDTAAIPNHIVPISGNMWLTSRVAWQIGTRTINIQAGDQWSQINLLLEAYST